MAMNQGMAMMMAAQARRRRDERGRYMGDEQMNTYNRRGENQYTKRRNEMRYDDDYSERGMRRTNNRRMDDEPDMKGEGYFVWDRANEYMPPERYGQPQNVTDMRRYRSPRSMMGEGGEKGQQKQGMIGFGEQDGHGKKLTKEKAEKWVKHMRSDDRKGEMWSMEDAKELAKAYDITEGQELIDFYAALNMMYSDYSAVAKEWDVDEEEYYAALACAFLYDRDGKQPSEKLAAYYKYVVPHEED